MAPRRSNRISAVGYQHAYINPLAPSFYDKNGNRYWTGFRNDVHFNAGMRVAVGAPGPCANCGAANSNSIDHIVDFATTSSGLLTEDYCDGLHHWNGVPWGDALADYNDVNNLQVLCTPCNSSKSGARGLYSPPTYVGPCPGIGCPL